MLWRWSGGARAAGQPDGQRGARPGTGYGQPAQAATPAAHVIPDRRSGTSGSVPYTCSASSRTTSGLTSRQAGIPVTTLGS